MSELADLVACTSFPGRVRQFAAPDPGQALALAVGAAWIEHQRSGHVAAIVPPDRRGDPLVREALALAGRLGLPNLLLLSHADPAVPCEDLGPRERQPVRLGSLGRDLVPRWNVDTPAAALGYTAAVEPLLMLPARDPRWGLGRATLMALAWIAGDGRRVAWELPAGTPLDAWTSELALIGRMQLPIKLYCDAADLPSPPARCGLSRWWVAMPDATDAGGVLTWSLAGEECVLAAMPTAWSGHEAWLPGSARRLADGDAGTMLCTAARIPPTRNGLGLLQLTSLLPLPITELTQAAQPLLTSDENLARHLADLDPRLRCTLAPTSATTDLPR